MNDFSKYAPFKTYSFINNLILKKFLPISTVTSFISLLDEEKAAAY